jgi:hypothetical protein
LKTEIIRPGKINGEPTQKAISKCETENNNIFKNKDIINQETASKCETDIKTRTNNISKNKTRNNSKSS